MISEKVAAWDEPRKKGVRRFAEILARDFRGLIKLNLLYCLCVLPSVVLFLSCLFGVLNQAALLLLLPAAFPVGGAGCALSFCITKMLRDEPGYVLYDFKRKFKENVKQAALPGILYAVFVCAQVYLWGSLVVSGAAGSLGWLILGFASLMMVWMISPYFFLQVAYIDLKSMQIVKNSVLISFGAAARSIAGAVTGGAVWIVFFLLLPDSLLFIPIILLFGFSLSRLLNLMWVWPPVDRQFSIEKTLSACYDEPAGALDIIHPNKL